MSEFDDEWAKAKAEPAPGEGAEFDKAWRSAKAEPAPANKEAPEEPGLMSPKGIGGSFLHGAVQGGLLGFGDEAQGLAGGMAELGHKSRRAVGLEGEDTENDVLGAPSLTTAYQRERDDARKENTVSEDTNPIAYNVGQLLGSFATPAPGPGKLKGAMRLLANGAIGAGIGGASALGNSTADITKGEGGQAAKDTAVGGAFGGVLGMVGGKISDWLKGRGAAAQQKAQDIEEKLAEQAANAARSSKGGITAASTKGIDRIAEGAVDPSLPEDLSRRASEALSGPELARVKAKVLENYLEDLPRNMGRLENADVAIQEAMAGKAPGVIADKVSERTSLPAAGGAIGSRLKTIATRTIPPMVGGYLANAALGPKWGLVGAGVGGLASAGLGKPLTVLQNMVQNPAVGVQAARFGGPVLNGATKALEAYAGRKAPEIGSKLGPYLELLHEKDGGQ